MPLHVYVTPHLIIHALTQKDHVASPLFVVQSTPVTIQTTPLLNRVAHAELYLTLNVHPPGPVGFLLIAQDLLTGVRIIQKFVLLQTVPGKTLKHLPHRSLLNN